MSSRLLLALETACGGPAVVLLRGDVLLAEAAAPSSSRGAESLLPCIDAVLAEAKLTLSDVEAFAVSIGPGSFTGLRVGVATLKGLAFEDPRPVAAVPTLAAMAHAAEADSTRLVALVDAQRGEFYAAGFDRSGGTLVACPPSEGVYTPAALMPFLRTGCVLVGEAAVDCAQALGAGAPKVAAPQRRLAVGIAVGRLGQARIDAGEIVSAADLVPRYVRRAEAEVQRTGQRFE